VGVTAVSRNVLGSKVPAVRVKVLVVPSVMALPRITEPLALLMVSAGVFAVAVEITPESVWFPVPLSVNDSAPVEVPLNVQSPPTL
jgi:hypothetical protein